MSRVRVNYKSDLPPIGITFMLGEHEIPVPTTDFVVRFFVEGSPGLIFECLHKGEEYINCEVTDEDTLTCYINNHGFCCGRLCCEFIDLSRNAKYADGVQKTVTPTQLNIVLVDGAGDDLVEITESIAIDIETVIGEIREAMEKLDEYADIIAALQAAVLTIPDVIDDLETGGHTDALSAEQGKILKEILDNLGRISVDGIKGFTPISSLNDLPLSPTTEQKRQAYIFENALYVYVGAGGDTLGGKYQSVELVSLDWGDKSYNASEFSGLGRRWLKKNVVDDKNVLTSAMIGTANTEYFIQYDYDLDGSTVTLPANASLVFMGGSIKNGTLIGSNTRIQAKKGVCIFDGITIQGTWDVAEAWSSWFKMHKAGYKIASVAENNKYRGTDNNYYELEDLTLIDSTYYVTDTLEGGEPVEGSISTIGVYSSFRIEGDNTDYIAAPAGIPGVFDYATWSGGQDLDDTAALQSLLDLHAKKTVIEEGVYMVNAERHTRSSGAYTGLFYSWHNDAELVIEGWLKVIPNDKKNYHALDVIDCDNIRISGSGGIQGDLLDHTGANASSSYTSEWGMNIAFGSTENLLLENLTFEYAWGDLVYVHWRGSYRYGGDPKSNDCQKNHTYRNLTLRYGGRSGFVSERGNNIVVDGCYFYGTGFVRGKSTYSAVDIEPFNQAEIPVRYVMNYEFKNNVFEHSREGLRLERCMNCSVHNNYFNDASGSAVDVMWHNDVSYDITDRTNRGWWKSYLKIYDNMVSRCSIAFYITSTANDEIRKYSDNIEIYGNTLVSCIKVLLLKKKLVNSRIFNNVTYGCGQWRIDGQEGSSSGNAPLVDCEIYNNRNYACKMPVITETRGAGQLLYMTIADFNSSKRSSFHHNHFSLDYGTFMYGLGEHGKTEYYHGLPLGYGYNTKVGIALNEPSKIHVYENYLSDDFTVYYGLGGTPFTHGICSVRNEDSEVFLVGDIFRSTTYGDEGVVTSGGMVSASWLADNKIREFSPGMTVAYGEIIRITTTSGSNTVTRYKICSKGGQCGDTLVVNQTVCGEAVFLSADATGYAPNSTSAEHIKICFTKRGICTSETRPDSFLYAGRKMFETDTNKEVVYDGNNWVYNDIYTEE